jgi:hypothetical protein
MTPPAPFTQSTATRKDLSFSPGTSRRGRVRILSRCRSTAPESDLTEPTSFHPTRLGSSVCRYSWKEAMVSASRKIPSPEANFRAFHSPGL